MKKVLLITTNFWPEPTGISIYTTDFAENLWLNSFDVTVLTSLPHYPWWRIPREFSDLGEGKGTHQGIEVVRVKHFIPTEMDAFKRVRFEISLWRNLNRVFKTIKSNDFSVIISCIPTVAAGLVGRRLARKRKVNFGLIVQDLSGVGAKQSGLRGGLFISKVAQIIEKFVIMSANQVIVVSSEMREMVIRLGKFQDRITVIQNYSVKQIDRFDKKSARAKFYLDQRDFTVIYTGNLGSKQGLENVVAASKKLLRFPEIKILIVGHGNHESKLKELSRGIKNIEFWPVVSESDYSTLLSAADVLLINERPSQIDMSLPSKLASYLYSNRPVLAAVPRGGATWKFLDGVAELVDAGDSTTLASKIEELSQNQSRLDELARLGLEFAVKNLDPVVGRAKYLEWVEKLIHSSKTR